MYFFYSQAEFVFEKTEVPVDSGADEESTLSSKQRNSSPVLKIRTSFALLILKSLEVMTHTLIEIRTYTFAVTFSRKRAL